MSFETKPHLRAAFRKIMRPLVTVLLREQVSYVEFIDLLEEVFIETTIRDGLASDVPKTIARVSVATGISKSEIDRYVYHPTAADKAQPVLTAVLAEIVHRWNTDPAYTGPYGGVARELDYDLTAGANFVELAKSTSPEIPPMTLLNELVACGAVQQRIDDDGHNRYRVLQRAFVFQNAASLSPGMAEHFATAMTDLASTLAHNFHPRATAKRVERAVYSTEGLTEEQVDEFIDFARASVTKLMVELDDLLAEMAKGAPASARQDRLDVGLNVFQYVRARENEPPLASLMAAEPQGASKA